MSIYNKEIMKLLKVLIPASTIAVVAPIASCACTQGYKVTFKTDGVSFPNADRTTAKRHQHFSVVGSVNPGVKLSFWKITIGNNSYLKGTDDRVRVSQTDGGAPITVSIDALLVEAEITIQVSAR